MNAEEYKRLINQKDIIDHTTLSVTLKEILSRQEFELAGNLKHVFENNKIEKPELHSKPYDTSTIYYKIDIPSEDMEKIIDIFLDLETSHLDENGETTPTASFYASLVDKWTQLAEDQTCK